MQFSISSQLEYAVTDPVAFILSVRARECPGQRLLSESFYVEGAGVTTLLETFVTTGTRFDRVHASLSGICTIRYQAQVEVNATSFPAFSLVSQGPETFGRDVLPYLYPSRYCQSDRIGRLSSDLVAHTEVPENQVRSIVDWVREHISYVSGSTDECTSATDTLVERAGVCRDFAHLGIALCRAMSIPARYFTGYAHDIQPPDFHACFETWIGGRWLFWDATGLASPDGVVQIGMGRDASDCSVCTSFGPLQLLSQDVQCHVLDPNYRKLTPEVLSMTSFSLEG
jgi:transglutaminase-like putative cysteine protease